MRTAPGRQRAFWGAEVPRPTNRFNNGKYVPPLIRCPPIGISTPFLLKQGAQGARQAADARGAGGGHRGSGTGGRGGAGGAGQKSWRGVTMRGGTVPRNALHGDPAPAFPAAVRGPVGREPTCRPEIRAELAAAGCPRESAIFLVSATLRRTRRVWFVIGVRLTAERLTSHSAGGRWQHVRSLIGCDSRRSGPAGRGCAPNIKHLVSDI